MAQLLAKALTPEGLALLIAGGAGLALYLIWRQVYNHIPSQLKELRKELKAEMRENKTELKAEMRQNKIDQDKRTDRLESRIDRLEDNILKEIRLLREQKK